MPYYMTYQYENFLTIGLTILAVIIVLVAQTYINNTYKKFKKIRNQKTISGAEVARAILDANGLSKIYVVEVAGNLSDHYDPARKVVRLSKDIFHGETVAAMSIAAHECGHAIQDKENYKPMRIRAFLVPFVNFVSYAGYFAIFIGCISGMANALTIGILMLLATLIFQLITLPVEFNASKRAIEQLSKVNKISTFESAQASEMLRAAAFTYIAGALSTLLNILRLVIMSRDRD